MAFVAAAVAMLSGRHARSAAIAAALLVFGWALLRHVPVLLGETLLSGAWTRAGKVLALTGGLLAVAATFPRSSAAPATPVQRWTSLERPFIDAGRWCLGLFLAMTGVQHFMFTPFVASLTPAWFPGDAVFWTYFAGVALVAGGIGLLVPFTARLAALLSGVMVFSWFWIVHLPRAMVGMSDSIALFEALAVAGIAFVLSGSIASRPERTTPSFIDISPNAHGSLRTSAGDIPMLPRGGHRWNRFRRFRSALGPSFA